MDSAKSLIVDRTHLVLVSSKLVLQKRIMSLLFRHSHDVGAIGLLSFEN